MSSKELTVVEELATVRELLRSNNPNSIIALQSFTDITEKEKQQK